VNSLIAQGILDGQFNELMALQDESNFLLEVIQLYFEVRTELPATVPASHLPGQRSLSSSR